MENATKALLIAVGVLISIIILTLGIYLYSMYKEEAKEYAREVSTIEINKINSFFEQYNGRDDLTAYDIATLMNKSKEYNYNVNISFTSPFKIDTDPEKFIKANQDYIFEYSDSSYDEQGRVCEMIFKRKDRTP